MRKARRGAFSLDAAAGGPVKKPRKAQRMAFFHKRRPLKPWERRLKILALVFSLLPLLWLGGQLAYGKWVLLRIDAWKADGSEERWYEANKSLHLPLPGADAILLLPGFADGPSVWQKMAPVFAEEGFEVLSTLLPGDLEDKRRTIDRSLAKLRAEDPDRRVWIVGHSLGGTLAFDTALREGTRISGVAMIAPFFDPAPHRTLGLTPKQWYRVLIRACPAVVMVDQRTPGHPHLDGKDGPATIRTWPFLSTWDYEGLFAAADAVRDRAAEWHGPLAAIIAADDEIVDAGAARRFFRGATNASPARIEEHPGGHVLPLSADAEALARGIARFFKASAP